MLNSRQHVTFTPGASATAATTQFASNLMVDGNTTHTGTLTQTGLAALNGGATATTLTLSGALTLATGTGSAATTSAVGDTPGGGTSTTPARADHVHGRETFSATAPVATTAGGSSAVGTAVAPARSDHTHGLATNTAGSSAPGDSAAAGAATTVARSDHTHGREAWGPAPATNISPQAGGGAAGTATTPSRSDHAHPTATPVTPAASAPGDAAVVGTSVSFAPGDHKHAREAFGTTPPAVTTTAGAPGSATSVARGDHSHSATVGSPVAETSFGGTTADGTSTSLARADHRHGTPAAPTPASVGAVSKTGDTMTGPLLISMSGSSGNSMVGLLDTTAAQATPNKYLRSLAGQLQVVNSAYSAVVLTIADSGALSSTTTVTGSTGVFDGANRVYSAANPPPISAPVVIMPFFVGGSIGVGLRAPQFLVTVPMTLRGVRSIAAVGSGTYQVYVNGASVSGAATGFSTTQALNDFTDVNVNVGDRVQLNVATASADATDLSVTVDVVTR